MKSLKLPSPENPQNFRLRSDEMFFLDLIIMTNENPAELYRDWERLVFLLRQLLVKVLSLPLLVVVLSY